MRRFEMKDETSNKYWEIALDAKTVSVHFGRIGTDGQVKAKVHPSTATARAEHDKLIAEKLAKGYREVGSETKTKETKSALDLVPALFAQFEALTKKAKSVAIWQGKITFPKGAIDKWRSRAIRYSEEKVGDRLDRLARELADGRRFMDLHVTGDVVEIRGWDWLDEWESFDSELDGLLETAAKLGAKGKVGTHGRFVHSGAKWVTRDLRNGKVDIDEGQEWNEKKAAAALATIRPARDEWLAKHPATRRRIEHTRLHGYIDRDGHEVSEPRFTRTYGFSEGLAVVFEDWRPSYVNREGSIALAGNWQDADSFARGMAPVAIEDTAHWGYVDRNGETKIAPVFEAATPFHQPVAVVLVHGGRHRWITQSGELVGDPFDYYQHDPRSGFFEGRAWIYDHEKTSLGCFDEQARPAFARRFHTVMPFSEGLSAVWEVGGSKWGYIDRTGNTVIPPSFDEAYGFAEGVAVVRIGKEHRLIDPRGKLVSAPFASDGMCSKTVSEGRLPVPGKGGVGFIDKGGELVIRPRYQQAAGFFEGRAAVAIRAKGKAPGAVVWGHIDADGEWVVRPTYDSTNRFVEGRAPVQLGRRWGFIGPDGALVVEPRYRHVQHAFIEGRAWVEVP